MKRRNDDIWPEYDLGTPKGGVRGKYYRRAMARTNLVLWSLTSPERFQTAIR